MKKSNKILSICALILSFNISNQALAKTEGAYVGVNIGSYEADHDMNVSSGAVQINSQDQFSNDVTGFGLEYKHAYNINGLFIAPGVFFDSMGNESRNAVGDVIDLNNRYGVKVDLGFDLDDKFSSYVTIGYSGVSYKSNVIRISGQNIIRADSSGRDFSPIIGLGFLFDLNENTKFSLEYNQQSIEGGLSSAVGYDNFETDISAVKFGVLFNF